MSDTTLTGIPSDVKSQVLLDRALVFVCDRLREGTSLVHCWRTWETWGLKGVAAEKSDWFDALGDAFRTIEGALSVSAPACVAGSSGMADVRAALVGDGETEIEGVAA